MISYVYLFIYDIVSGTNKENLQPPVADQSSSSEMIDTQWTDSGGNPAP